MTADKNIKSAFILGIFIFLGMTALGWIAGSSAVKFKRMERTVIVKGLSERELPADTAMWPIQFSCADNDLTSLYSCLADDSGRIRDFLIKSGFKHDEITVGIPSIVDKLAQRYGGNARIELRYTARQNVTVYSTRVDLVRKTMTKLLELGRKGIVFSGGGYETAPDFIFTRLNEIKPAMIEEATRKGGGTEICKGFRQQTRQDQTGQAGTVHHHEPGQKYTVHQKVRVVSTVEYYLAD